MIVNFERGPSMQHSRILFCVVLCVGLVSGSGSAQNVQYSGKLRIGFGDADNLPGVPFDSGFPRCGREPLTPSAPNRTFETLLVNAVGTQVGTGTGADLIFNAVGAGQGGAQVKVTGTCQKRLSNAPQGRLRSHSLSTSIRWPSNLGSHMSAMSVMTSPASPMATYRLSAGGGIAYSGSTLMHVNPVGLTLAGDVTLTKGPNHFGGGAPVQAARNFNVGILSQPAAPGDFGSHDYFSGGTRGLPLPIGDAGMTNITIPTAGTLLVNPGGLLIGNTSVGATMTHTYAARTPGGTTQNQHGAIRTLGGGNTVTPSGTVTLFPTPIDCTISTCPKLISPIQHRAALFAWTTGNVRISDLDGIFETIRSASGFDVAATGAAGTTRRIQLVSPFSSSFRPFGLWGLPVPRDMVSGVAILTLNVIPVPEPSGFASLVLGVGMLFLARRRSASRPGRARLCPNPRRSTSRSLRVATPSRSRDRTPDRRTSH